MELNAYMLEIKLLLVVLSGVLGIFGVLGKFVHDGQLTVGGKASLIMLIISICGGVIVQLYEFEKDTENTRFNALMFNSVKKSILPLQPNWSHVFICMSNVDDEIKKIVEENHWDKAQVMAHRMTFSKSEFVQKLSLWTSHSYGFSKEPIPENSTQEAYYQFEYHVETDDDPSSSYVVERGKQVCHISIARPGDTLFSRRASSRLISVPDLVGSYMYIKVGHSRQSPTKLHMKWLDFELYPGLHLKLGNRLRAVYMDKAITVYEFRFPENEGEFWKYFDSR